MSLSREDFRYLLKDSVRQEVNFASTDQGRGLPPPPVQKPPPEDAQIIPLPDANEVQERGRMPLARAIAQRESRRDFGREPLALEELSWLLWATQGVKGRVGISTLRTVPSAGARHPFETYLFVFRVKSLTPGLYRYLPMNHALCRIHGEQALGRKLGEACLGQHFVGEAAVTFAWAAIPQRTEWRYGNAAARVILMDVGHICQNLYLACESIKCGTCGIGAYAQDAVDALLHVDGTDEFAVYLAPVGRVQ